LPGARAEGESKARGALGLCSSRALEAKENSEAREARSGRRIKHPEIICIPVDALKESLSAVLVSQEEGGGERRSFREENWHGNREASLYCVDCARGGSLLIGGEGGRCMDVGISHGEEARSPIERSLGIIIDREEGNRGESLRQGDRA
jgi:hypothetical protein